MVDNVPRGETAGAVMVLNQVYLQAGDRDLLTEVSWQVMPGQRWGLVGANGCGKSTLLRALCGTRQVDAGSVTVAPRVAVGYLEQTAVSGSQRTVWQEARSHMTSLLQAERDMQLAMVALEAGEVGAAERLVAAQDAFVMAGGPEADKRITNILSGLGFRQEQFHVPASQFSGGWQMRIALARLLLGEAGQAAASGLKGGLLLLDEPTNHLDSAAIRWLGSFLRTSGGTLVVVSHDEALLGDACDHIAEMRGRKIHTYVGGYQKFLAQRAEREVQAKATAAAQLQEIERLEAWVTRFGAKATKASAAQSKAKLAAKLRAEMVEVPVAASAEGGGDAKKVTLKLPRAPPCFTDVLMLKGASMGWGPAPGTEPAVAAARGRSLLASVDLVIKKGMRVLVLGPNGAGKSTLLKVLSGSLPLWAGTRKLGEGVKLGIFSQDLAQDLPQDVTALAYVEETARAHNRGIMLEQCRKALGALGLTDSMVDQRIGVLSGGEKARVALAAFALVPANVLLLDEASNHLDAATIKVLTGALQDFDGTIVAITHNPSFARSLNPTHVLRVAAGQVALGTNMGLRDEDFEHTPGQAASAGATTSTSTTVPVAGGGAAGKGAGKGAGQRQQGSRSSQSPSPSPQPSTSSSSGSGSGAATAASPLARKRTTLSWKEQQEYQKLGKELEELTSKRDKLQAQVSQMASEPSADFKVLEATSLELGRVSEQVEACELRWLELAELAGDI